MGRKDMHARRSAASKRAWATRRANKAAAEKKHFVRRGGSSPTAGMPTPPAYGVDFGVCPPGQTRYALGETDREILEEQVRRGGTIGQCARAQLLVLRKSEDYNQADATRDQFFPFGLESYTQMVHTKSLRLVSLALKAKNGGEPNFEGVEDTAIDIINYASFLLERVARGSRCRSRATLARCSSPRLPSS